jgi:hypothetical protein
MHAVLDLADAFGSHRYAFRRYGSCRAERFPDVSNDNARLTNGVDVAGYVSWGTHSTLGAEYATNGTIRFGSNSGWFVMTTIESYNGFRSAPDYGTYENNWLGGFLATPTNGLTAFWDN